MTSREFKILLSVQIFTLIIVSIILLGTLRPAGSVTASTASQGIEKKPAEIVGKPLIDTRDDFYLGDAKAPNQLIIFSRYNCSHCRDFDYFVVDSLMDTWIKPGKLRIVFKDLATPDDTLAYLMAKVAEVGRQLHRYREVQHYLITGNEPQHVSEVIKLAHQAGLTDTDLRERLNSPETLAKITNDYNMGTSAGIQVTPTLVVNGTIHNGFLHYGDVVNMINNPNTSGTSATPGK
jgi:protein-disulfide isomerase